MWMFVSISCGVPTDHDTFDLIQLLLREKFGHAERPPKLKDHVKYGLPKEYVFGKEKLFFSISGHTTICKYYLMCLLSCESLGEPVPHCASSQTYYNLIAALLGLPRKKIKLKLESTDGPTLKKQARRGNCKSKKRDQGQKGPGRAKAANSRSRATSETDRQQQQQQQQRRRQLEELQQLHFTICGIVSASIRILRIRRRFARGSAEIAEAATGAR